MVGCDLAHRPFIYWLEELSEEQSGRVGGKSANLGRMLRLGVPVPPGFAIAVDAHRRFMEITGLLKETSDFLRGKQFTNVGELTEGSKMLRQMVEEREIPEELKLEVIRAYQALCNITGISQVPVAVRSSGVAEDSAAASYAGQFDTYLNVRGQEELLNALKRAWSSTFNARVLGYRAKKGLPSIEFIGVCILKMVKARSAGVVFTADPNSGQKSRITIEANWGLGESVVGGGANGKVVPDRWILDKQTLNLLERSLGRKEWKTVPMNNGTGLQEVGLHESSSFCLTDSEVKEIGRFAKLLEAYYGVPQDVEWVIEEETGKLFFVQTRPLIISKRDAVDYAVELVLSKFLY